jgi:alanine dehydrogenase
MQILSAADVAAALTPGLLVDALRSAFRSPIEVPVRHHHTIDKAGEPAATLLLMPAWHGAGAGGGYVGVKIVTVVPGNARRHKATVVGSYLLLSGETGEPVAMIDGRELTLWRTAAASALAAGYLARPDTAHMVMVGAGALAPYLVRAHAEQFPLDRVTIWNRDLAKAEALAAALDRNVDGRLVRVSATADLDAALAEADLVSAATLSAEPLVRGARLRPGTHVDLVGGFTPDMREADDEAVRRASVFVDTRAGACHEAGDIVQPLRSGVLAEADIRGDLFDLCRGLRPGRTSGSEITLFKSVGTALEDLAAAVLVWERFGKAA